MDLDPNRTEVNQTLQGKPLAVVAAVRDLLALTCSCGGKFFIRTSRPIPEDRRRRTWFCPRCRKTKIEIVSAGVDRTTKSVPKLLDSRGEILPKSTTPTSSTSTTSSTMATPQATPQAPLASSFSATGKISFATLQAQARERERNA